MTLNDLTELLQAEPYDGTHLDAGSERTGRPNLRGLIELHQVTGAGCWSTMQSYRTARGELVALAALRAANRQAHKTRGVCERVLEFLGAR